MKTELLFRANKKHKETIIFWKHTQWRIQELTLGGAWTLSTGGGGGWVENH